MTKRYRYIPNRVIDTNGISDGASIYIYQRGTTTPVTIYTDAALTTPATNPYVVVSGAAVPELYHNESNGVRVKVVESSGTTVSDEDPYIAADSSAVNYTLNATGASERLASDKLSEFISVKDFGAVGDGSTDDTSAVTAAVTATAGKALRATAGDYGIDSGATPSGGAIIGDGPDASSLVRTATGTLLSATDRLGDRLEGVTLNLDRTTLGNEPGHGFSFSGKRVTVRDVTVSDYGSDGIGGGTGVLAIPGTTYTTPETIRIIDCNFYPDPLASITVGWLFADAVYSFSSRNYAHNVVAGIGYAHELKDSCTYNSVSQIIASESNACFVGGGSAASQYNVVTNVVAAKCDQAVLISQGVGNVVSSVVHNATGGPGNLDIRAVQLSGGAAQNYVSGVLSFGALAESVYISGDKNVVDIAAHDTATNVATFTSGSDKNFVNITHPGARTSVISAISDSSGFDIDSTSANVVHSPMTGERIGSISGRFWDKLGSSGVTPLSSHKWVYESDQYAIQALQTPGASGDISGLAISNARDGAAEGRIWHVTGASQAANYWTVAIGGVTDVIRIYNNGIRLGASGPQWFSGAGSPEGVVTAPVGSFYSRTNGGAGTSFYVKESGTGNTGWVAK